MITEREYKHWITKNCSRNDCWLVVSKLGEMIAHTETTVIGPDDKPTELPLVHDGLEYVYLVDFAPDRLITLVQDKEYYYLIDNTEYTRKEGDEEIKDYKSKITFDPSLDRLVARMPSTLRKKLKLKPMDKVTLKPAETKQLQGVVAVDFIAQPHIMQVKLFRDYAKQNARRLDLSGLFILEPKVIEDTAVFGKMHFDHDEVVLYQNNRFHKFGWLKHFPKVKTLTLWYINQVQDADIDLLVASAPGLETLEFHYCFQLTGRVIIPISKLKKLTKLIISYEKCILQEKAYETVITDQEWSQISNNMLSIVLIDSHNLTLDFIDLFIKSFKGLEHFIMNEITLEKLQKNSADGFHDREEPISFHSVKDTKVGFKRFREVKIYDQVRSKCGVAFSDSMLRKIKERNPEKAEAADLMFSGAS
jgi:hypothetical protein